MEGKKIDLCFFSMTFVSIFVFSNVSNLLGKLRKSVSFELKLHPSFNVTLVLA